MPPELTIAALQIRQPRDHVAAPDPNPVDIRAHLYALFAPAFVQPYPDAWIEIAFGHPNIRNGAVQEAQNYSAFELEKAAKFAEAKNRAGYNIYVGPALRHGTEPGDGRAGDASVLTSAYGWAEFDGADDAERIEAIRRITISNRR